MPLLVPKDLPAIDILEKEQIFIMQNERAQTQDIRPLRFLILNLMPKKEETETQLLRMLSNTPLQVVVDFLYTSSYEAKNTSKYHLERFYKTFEEVKTSKYDAMIITGAPIEHLDFEEVEYWDELMKIMDYAKENVYSTLFICWASQAGLYYHYGIPKYSKNEKIFGVFEYKVQAKTLLTKGFDDIFYIPQSRYTFNKIEDVAKTNELKIISGDSEAGINIAISTDQRQIFIAGHFEYDEDTLFNEYTRDRTQGLETKKPQNYFDENGEVIVKWRSSANLFFTNWINYLVYQETPYDISKISKDVLPTSKETP